VAGPAIGAKLMAQILPFIGRSSVFAPDVTLAIYPDAESQFVVRELIAKRIKGGADRDQLCTSAAQMTILFGVPRWIAHDVFILRQCGEVAAIRRASSRVSNFAADRAAAVEPPPASPAMKP
jgi:hypothetical protein